MAPRRIGLLGGESSGKTTLAMGLADALPGFVAEEYLRDFVRDF
ncbi:MAG: AAA family ATPase, partial [Candidatus Nanopelagicales bacterium]